MHTRIVGERNTGVAREPPRVPSLALTKDGRVLISLHYIDGADISDHETWTCIVLTEAEGRDVRNAIANSADDVAAQIGGRLIACRKTQP